MTADSTLLPFEGDGQLIRRQWHEDRWYFSVVDVVGLLTDSATPRMYWADMKRRIQDEGFLELLARCQQLKMRSLDGKSYSTDAADVETMLRIVQSIPSPKAEPVKRWLAKVGTERLEEIAASDLLAGLTEEQRRLYTRAQLTDHNRQLAETASTAGVITPRDFAIFQDHGYRGLYGGETSREIGARKGLRRGQHILDHMGSEELAANLFRATQTEAKLRREGVTASQRLTAPTTRLAQPYVALSWKTSAAHHPKSCRRPRRACWSCSATSRSGSSFKINPPSFHQTSMTSGLRHT